MLIWDNLNTHVSGPAQDLILLFEGLDPLTGLAQLGDLIARFPRRCGDDKA
ncbi:hypothetical protein [Pseudosporangium ferrugineum]|uniref:Uncharacterized protein n=1 Tax=Pseudosporangium ferrugineum TaxID=439699 RepID=A0A2T0RCJ6_9ACTN|nr:hypothetical protein [Pseudosporangium ferrugineum]PRY18873.1 hypothetical protein CLV70_1423 [Pseudosporangium ferrugineum]